MKVEFASVCLLLLNSWSAVVAGEPEVLDERLSLSLVAREPDIVTPVGATFDHKGRLLVIESHTHFPPENYTGPKHDRIRLVEDTDDDDRADRFRTFYEGTRATMSITVGPENWIYVATRMEVFRIRDTDGDDVADERQEIASLKTKGNYPHNGLCGLAFNTDQSMLYFGLGENLGEDYVLVSSDGRELAGGGEGGNIYECRPGGARLRRVATGFWNPFGICVDRHQRVFCVGNDPDSTPPCRLMHVIPGGDYGYQFRYGRSGRHPLQAWDGQLPGTLPMLAGTGEAPCAVLPYHGRLWVTSWGDYRIERFALHSHGASFQAKHEVVVQGDHQFRPVDFAVAPDGSLYFTDWVDRSYPVHGKGRIWRLSWKTEPPEGSLPELSHDEERARRNAHAIQFTDLPSSDPFRQTAAAHALARAPDVLRGFLTYPVKNLPPEHELGVLMAARQAELDQEERAAFIDRALQIKDARVLLLAVRWIADERLTEYREALDNLSRSPQSDAALFQAVAATIEWLDEGKVANLKRSHRGHYFAGIVGDDRYPPEIQTLALQSLPPDHKSLTVERLLSLAESKNVVLQREAVRSLVLSSRADRFPALEKLAMKKSIEDQIRADAVAGLAADVKANRRVLETLRIDESKPIAAEAARRLSASSETGAKRPAATATADWLNRLRPGGDPDAGWRLFFGARGARCGSCHMVRGRGRSFGPDLTNIARRMSRPRLIESILQPSLEIAPRFVPWVLEMKNGQVHSGIGLNRPGGGKERFADTDGKIIEVQTAEIESRRPGRKSIMPDGLEKTLTDQELRDLLAFLTE